MELLVPVKAKADRSPVRVRVIDRRGWRMLDCCDGFAAIGNLPKTTRICSAL
jgi:hypothetical protein